MESPKVVTILVGLRKSNATRKAKIESPERLVENKVKEGGLDRSHKALQATVS